MDSEKYQTSIQNKVDYGTIVKDGQRVYVSPEQQAEQHRVNIHQTKNALVVKRNHIRLVAYFLVGVGVFGFVKQIYDIVFDEPEKVVIEGESYREEIDISQGFLLGERLFTALRDLLFVFQGRYYLIKLRQTQNLQLSQKMISTTVIVVVIHFMLISLQYYFSCFLLQDVIRTWQASLSQDVYHQKSRSGTFSYTRTKIGSGFISQDMEIIEEEVDISLIAIGMVFIFLCMLGCVTFACFGIMKCLISYKEQFVKLEGLHTPPETIELQKTNLDEEECDESTRLKIETNLNMTEEV
ncbi:unnamed protein product [Moneuplotes crassus]|uniref:Uncharacterized protein n=1 Tax=Euplotes crassus TaxID=5936 RepID=A0AAD1XQU6_EUPCR|nr:unnamed protein product [Moneuplotes crassus]